MPRAVTPRTLPVLAVLALWATLATAGCTEGDYCADVFANAWVTDVGHDQDGRLLTFAVSHSLSYCTGTDEKRYSHERVTVDLETGAVDVEQRFSNDARGYDLLEVGRMRYLYHDGHFGNQSACSDCQLLLEAEGTPRYGYRFVARAFESPPVVLEVSEDDVPLLTIDLGYAHTALRAEE